MMTDPYELCRDYASKIEHVHEQARREGMSNPVVLVFQGTVQPKGSRRMGPIQRIFSAMSRKLETCSIVAVPHDTELMTWVGLPGDLVNAVQRPSGRFAFFAIVVSKRNVSVVEFRTVAVDFFPYGLSWHHRMAARLAVNGAAELPV